MNDNSFGNEAEREYWVGLDFLERDGLYSFLGPRVLNFPGVSERRKSERRNGERSVALAASVNREAGSGCGFILSLCVVRSNIVDNV